MTGSASPAIDAVVALWNTGSRDDVLTQLQGNPSLVDGLRAEVTRLETSNARRNLLHPDRGDAVSKRLHADMKAILERLTADVELG